MVETSMAPLANKCKAITSHMDFVIGFQYNESLFE